MRAACLASGSVETFKFIAEAVVVLGAIVMGTKSSGVALGLWGGTGVAVLVFIFREQVGTPPVDAMLIILSVVLASSLMQVSGGIDWMVTIAARVISAHPRQITLIGPLVAFLFSVGAGTSNILYPLLPVIQKSAYEHNIRPERPLSLAVVSSGVALACSPVSAAMAAMVTLDRQGSVPLRADRHHQDHAAGRDHRDHRHLVRGPQPRQGPGQGS